MRDRNWAMGYFPNDKERMVSGASREMQLYE
jgi:hypothetical protein